MAAGLVHPEDVGVVECTDRPCLLLEAAQVVRVNREGGGQHLDRDLAPEARVARAIDLAHAPGAERRDNLVGPASGS